MISQDVHIYSCQIRRASNKTVVPMTKKLEKTYKGSCCPAVFSSANILRAKPLTQPNCNQNLQVWPAWFFFFFLHLFLAVSVAAWGLYLIAVNRGYSLVAVVGFSLRWLLLLWSMGFRYTRAQ